MKKTLKTLCLVMLVCCLIACEKEKEKVKIGVSFGVGEAVRWPQELEHMKNRAKKLDVELETRLNKGNTEKTQEEDCKEMVDSGIDVLIVTPRNIYEASEIVKYAKEHDVKVISYARLIWEEEIDLFVGYDTYLVGCDIGKYATEKVYKGDYIILKGDENDTNTFDLYNGMMKYVEELKDSDINVIEDAYVTGWDPEVAKQIVRAALDKNGNKVDAILAPNDKLAAASIEVLEERGILDGVLVTGMDAELSALQRIVTNKQSCSVYMNLQDLAVAAIDRAIELASEDEVGANGEVDNGGKKKIKTHLFSGTVISAENIDKVLIDTKVFTKGEIYQ